MEKQRFTKLIQEITGRDLIINTSDDELLCESEYYVYKHLPILDRYVGFLWKTPKTYDRFLRSFITAFSSKYKEPSPSAHTGKGYGPYNKEFDWNYMSDKQKEYCYFHNSSYMYSKESLLEQIEKNFEKPTITDTLCRYGFYTTEYGIGIFSFFLTDGVANSIIKMENYLNSKGIPYRNEYSDARWVYRFILGLNKVKHNSILQNFN